MVDNLNEGRRYFEAVPIQGAPAWMSQFFKRIQQEFEQMRNRFTYEPLGVEPTTVWDGLTVMADGIGWDPGFGRGLYSYDSTTLGWIFIGGDVSRLDAFGRQRVSQVTTLLDIKHKADKQPRLIDEEIIGGATAVHSTTNASVAMSVSATADVVIRQSFQRLPYFAGKSQQFFFTFDNFSIETNVLKRVGCFSSNTTTPFDSTLDGIFLESDGITNNDIAMVIYKSGTQTARVTQADWDDPMDGTGRSGISIDWTKAQILEFDYEYLGVGGVRMFFVTDFLYRLAHTYKHANVGNSTYMSSPNLPIRYEIRQTGAGSGSMEMVCSTGGTEGAMNRLGKPQQASLENVTITLATPGTYYAVAGIRLKTTTPGAYIEITGLDLYCTSADDVHWKLIRNPTVTGTFNFNPITDSAIEEAFGTTGPPTVTGGENLGWDGYAAGGAGSSPGIASSPDVETSLHLGTAIDGTVDEFILCATPVNGSANANVSGSIRWREID